MFCTILYQKWVEGTFFFEGGGGNENFYSIKNQ